MSVYNNILFVCTGNTCRSPFAAGLLRKMLKDKYKERANIIKTSSAGIYAFTEVSPPPNAIRIAGEYNVDLSAHKSRVIHLTMIESADIIFCMTSRQRSHLISKFPWFEDKIHILKRYALEGPGHSDVEVDEEEKYDIQDPIGQTLDMYRTVYGEIRDSLIKIIQRWEDEEGLRKQMAVSYKIAVASDHAGFLLKQNIIEFLKESGHIVQDYGVDRADVSVDYPDFARPAAESVARGENDYGILFCGSGVGVSIVANKVKGIRAVPCNDPITAKLSRAHNDANVLTLGERLTTPTVAREIVKEWLSTQFEGGRHERRVRKVEGE